MYWIIPTLLLGIFLLTEASFLKALRNRENVKKEQQQRALRLLLKEEDKLKSEIAEYEKKIAELFFFYELARKIAPVIDRQELFKNFAEEIRYLSGVEDAQFMLPPPREGYKVISLGEGEANVLCVKTSSRSVQEYLPHFTKLLTLCLERIALYDRLHQLSIYDTLTETCNRRYFMMRYLEEFNRAEKFALSVSFLMIDIDHFKNINDTYGHLVGDVVLREIARLIKENIREIDFVARFGGEEFAVILPETDKGGAIMVGERIRSKISQERLRAFDEMLGVTISIGVASFPQNTLHSDVLVEAADRALYKAKILGRNRVCWF